MVIEPALQRLSTQQLKYLVAMAEGDSDIADTGSIAAALGKTPSAASKIRGELVKEGVVEQPRRGAVSFAIPYLKDYLASNMSELLEHSSSS